MVPPKRIRITLSALLCGAVTAISAPSMASAAEVEAPPAKSTSIDKQQADKQALTAVTEAMSSVAAVVTEATEVQAVVIPADLELTTEEVKNVSIKPAPEEKPKAKKKAHKGTKASRSGAHKAAKHEGKADASAKKKSAPVKKQEKKPEPAPEPPKDNDDSPEFGQKLLAEAEKYLDTKYVFGGGTPETGFDCSGLTSWVYGVHGIEIPHSSEAQRKVGRVVSQEEALPGDIIWSPGHVSLYMGEGKQIEASRPLGWKIQIHDIWQDDPVFIRVSASS